MSIVKSDKYANRHGTDELEFDQIKAAVEHVEAEYADVSSLPAAGNIQSTNNFLLVQNDGAKKVAVSSLLSALGLPAVGANGRVLPIATTIDSLSDLNTITDPGWYRSIVGGSAGSRNVNHPDNQTAMAAGNGVSNYYFILVVRYGTNALVQIAVPYLSADDFTFATIKFRHYYGSGWSSWTKILNDKALPATPFGKSILNAADANTARTLLKSNSPIKQVNTATYTLTLDDVESMIEFTSSAAVTVTVPAQVTVAWPDNATVHLVQAGTGKVTIEGASGVTILKPASAYARTAEQEATISLKRRALNSWRLIGMLEVV